MDTRKRIDIMRNITVRIEDLDIFPGLERQAEFFIDILRRRYDVTILTDKVQKPDILFFTCYGGNNLKWNNSIRIYYTAERDFPNYNLCDYAIGLSDIGIPNRFLHFPIYVFYNDLLRKYESIDPTDVDPNWALEREFCSTVVSDPFRDRIYFDLFKKLNEYKTIASGGRLDNTTGFRVPDKLEFIKNYKFNLAFENMKAPGYVTEKLLEPFVARTVPIYWGSSDWAKKEFGEGGYIDISDFDTLDQAVEYIKKVDNDNDLYMQILRRGAQMSHTYEEWCNILLDYLTHIIEHGERIYDCRRNYSYNERSIYYRIRDNKLVQLYRKIIRAINHFRLYGRHDVGEIYKTH